MFKKIALGLAGALALFLIFVAFQSPDYVVSREISIHQTPDKIFPLLNSSKLAEQWGPWLEVDPQAKMQYSGPDLGVGSKASWESTGQLGTGSATIVESQPYERVAIQLEYSKPFVMQQYSEYLVRTSGDQSVVMWKVSGKNSFLGRIMGVFFDMDKIVGSMFEKGLANLKTIAEKQP